ncbi:hypothetical protein ACE6H2_020275 [Prunus campanulata]
MAKKKNRASHDREMQETNQTSVARKGKSQDRASGTAHPQSSRLSLDRHISNESLHDNKMQETSRARKRKNQNRASDITHPQSSKPSLDQHDDLIEPSHDNEMEDMHLETEPSNGEEVPQWPTFKTFPSTQMDLLYDRFNATEYTHTCSEEEMRETFEEHIKLRYSDWMSSLRNSVLKKYKTTDDRYTHCPLGISQDVWSKLVDHWLQPTWQDKSKRNKSNRAKSTIVHTTGSVPMEKYRKDEDKMENKKVVATEDKNEVDDWDIYKEVIGGPSHGRILGLGDGYSTKDVYPSDD